MTSPSSRIQFQTATFPARGPRAATRHAPRAVPEPAGRLAGAPGGIDVQRDPSGLSTVGRAVSARHYMPVHLRARMHIAGSAGRTEPAVWLHGTLAFSSPKVRVIFRDRPRDPRDPREAVAHDVRLVPFGVQLAPRWSPVKGVLGRSRIGLQLEDGEGRWLAPEQDLGDCSAGVRQIAARLVLEVGVRASVTAHAWRDSNGPSVAVTGELMFPRGVIMKLGFIPDGAAERLGQCLSDVQLIHPGFTVSSSERRFASGHANPTWVSVMFLGESGVPIVDEQVVGCFGRGRAPDESDAIPADRLGCIECHSIGGPSRSGRVTR